MTQSDYQKKRRIKAYNALCCVKDWENLKFEEIIEIVLSAADSVPCAEKYRKEVKKIVQRQLKGCENKECYCTGRCKEPIDQDETVRKIYKEKLSCQN